MLLKDNDSMRHSCIDIRIVDRISKDYELSTGRVEVDGNPIDEEIIVIFNKKWNGSFSTDIIAAFKPNIDTGRIEELKYKTITIYREE